MDIVVNLKHCTVAESDNNKKCVGEERVKEPFQNELQKDLKSTVSRKLRQKPSSKIDICKGALKTRARRQTHYQY